jgi:GntR family transcriptional regulator/MocR family aminotransferase
MITRGSQMALDLLARALITPGDMVAVESPTYPNAVSTFRRAGAEVVAIPVDQQGMDLDVLTELVRRRRIRLVYTTPHHQYPTTVTLAATRRLKLLDLVERHGIALLEDDYDQEYHYDGRPVLPLASRDPKGHVIYVGTLAKVFAPGLRLAFIVAPPTLIEHLGRERALIDRQGDAALECAVAELLDDGDVQRHVRRTRRIYHQRRDAFCATTDRLLSNALCYRCPPGGLAIWAQVAPELDLELWYHRCAERGVAFQIGRHFTLDGKPSPHLRLGFAILDEKSSATALRRMADALPLRSRPRK